MPTSHDGILTADYLTEQNLVRLIVHGDKVPQPGIVRTNLHPDPRGTAVGSLWGYQLGTGETAETTLVTESTPKRTNLIRNPRSVASGTQWTQGGGTSGSNYTADNITGWTQNVVPGVTTARRITLTNAAGVTSLYFRPTPTAATDGVPVTPGMWAGYKAVVQTSRSIPFRAFMQFYDASGAFISSNSPSLYTTAAGVAQEVSTVGVVPAGAAFMIPYIGQSTGAAGQANGDTWLCSAVIDAQASTEAGALAMLAEPYFDGDTPNTGDTTYAWTGPANASTSTATFNDGPLLPDGSRIGTYVRRTVTAAKTGGSSGPWCRTPTGTFGLVVGDQVSPTMHVRFSVDVTVNVSVQTRTGSTINGSETIPNVVIPAWTWVRVGGSVTATAAADSTQVWAVLAAGTILPVGTTVDTTGGQVELGAITPYFDGSTTPSAPGMQHYWTGTPNASASVEEQMTGPAQFVEIERSAPGMATERVNSDLPISAPGGWYTGVDAMAPMNAAVTYTITARTEWGEFVVSATVTVDTSGAVWGLWLKNPGDPSLNTRVEWRGIGTRSRATQGARYDPPGSGFAIVEWDGVGPEEVTIQVATRTGAETRALDALLDKARVLFLQSDPSEMPNGYYYVPSVGRDNPAQVIDTVEGYRVTAIPLVRSEAPAGESAGYTGGPTFQSVLAQYATFQDVLDQVPTFLGLTNPETI